MADDGHLDKNTERKINLTALKKHDKDVDKIIDTASSVAHYKFDSSTESWTKTDMEGSLFVYSRSKDPYIAFFIMNRLSTENCKIYVSQNMEFKIQEPFVLCRTSPTEIIGIWFYDQHECARIGVLLERLAGAIGRPESLQRFVNPKADVYNRPLNEEPPVDVLSMFAKATKLYEEEQQSPGARQMSTKPRSKAEERGQGRKKSLTTANRSKPPDLKRTISVPTGCDENTRTNNSHQQREESDQEKQIRAKESFQEVHKRDADQLMSLIKGGIKRTRSVTLPSEPFGHMQPRDVMLEQKPEAKKGGKPVVIDVADLEAKVLQRSPPNEEAPKMINHNDLLSTTEGHVSINGKLNPSKLREASSIESSSRASSTTSLLTPSSLSIRPQASAATVLNSPAGRGRGVMLPGIVKSTPKNSPISGDQFSLRDSSKLKLSAQRKLFNDPDAKATSENEGGSSVGSISLLGPSAFQTLSTDRIGNSDDSTAEEKPVTLSKQMFIDSMVHLMQTDDSFASRLYASYLEVSSRSANGAK